MANPVKALQMGFDYQALIFWTHVCRLFESRTKVGRVGYELDEIKSFDDIVVSYHTPVPDGTGGYVSKDYHQVKFHVDQDGSITFEALIDPAFIGATKYSLLQKLKNALSQCGEGSGYRFYLVTPWTIHPDDLLRKLVSNDRGAINLDRLYEGITDRSEMGGIRQKWRAHLEIDDDDLRNVIRPLRIHSNSMNIEQLERVLNAHLIQAGFRPFDETKVGRPYEDLTRRLHRMNLNNFSREEIQKIAIEEDLYVGGARAVVEADEIVRIGIRSFWRFAEHLEDEVDDLLSLNHYFNHRHILSSELWQEAILPEVKAFIGKYVESTKPVQLFLDTHGVIAFAAGYYSDSKGRSALMPMQCGIGMQRELWTPTGTLPADRGWRVEDKEVSPQAEEVAVAISITHDVSSDVLDYVGRELPKEIGKVLLFDVLPRPGRASIVGGGHAYQLAEELAQRLFRIKKEKPPARFHLFIAGPNGFQFHLGALSHLFGDCVLYEYEFEAKKLGAYSPSLTLRSG
jgi:hypothetical protein